MFLEFFYELRRRKVPVSTHEWLALMRALSLGLHDSSLDGFYELARAGHVSWGVGGLASVYHVPRALEPAYGDGPVSFMLFVRGAAR